MNASKSSRYARLTEESKARNRTKPKVRSRVEHAFHVFKCQIGFTKVRVKRLDKYAKHQFASCALVNRVLAKTRLLRLAWGHCFWSELKPKERHPWVDN
jgi:IS5 family transposase